jgi:ATP-dependent Lhr-like helicase
MELLDPIIKEWFEANFNDLTPPQAQTIPLIHYQKNVLVASPTGSGKTLTAFLMILNELFKLGKEAKLENKIYCVYISPLKALANDIERNLKEPLKQIYQIAHEHGITLPEIRVGVRSGDTSTAERQRMVKKPPHILITTPESLSIIISTKRFRLSLLDTQFVIVDEIHEICSSKRGVLLSLSLERLQHQILTEGLGYEFIRIGLSATQAPISEIAKFLGGYNNERKLRNMSIIETPSGKKLDLRVVCPVKDMNLIPYEIINAKMYNILHEQIKKHRSTLIFTNTRRGTETVVFKLQELGLDKIAAHHGSLSKETRFDVEAKLKKGDLAATICSTSLELGIDIGYIDLVCQIGSPKSIAKGVQRIGRAGHALHEISKGRIIVFDRDDLVECAVLVKNAYSGNIDRINILRNSLDVLAQVLVGMSLEKRWGVDEAYDLVRQSYCYNKLSKKEFLKVLNYTSGKHTVESKGVYGKIRYDPDTRTFGIKHGARIIYNLNIGTIPQEANYRVVLVDTGFTIGALSENFVERLNTKDVFVLGGKSYEFIKIKGMKIFVRDAHGKKPTIPSWTGEMLPRSFDLSCEVGKFRNDLALRLSSKNSTQDDVEGWLRNEYYLDHGSAKSIVNYFIEQLGMIKAIPSNDHVLIEGYTDGRGFKNIIFHFCFGRRVNDALSRAYAYVISKKFNCTVRISLTDDNFMLTLPKHIKLTGIERLLNDRTLNENLKYAVQNTELFKQRFRHCAVRSFMILRNYKGSEISVRKQLKRSSSILDMLHNLDNIPVVEEAYNEIMNDAMDIEHAEDVLRKIKNGEISVSYSNYSNIPSPFSHNVVLIGVSDIILMEDKSALLRELHQQVLSKVFSDLEITKPRFELDIVNKYFKNKLPVVNNKASLLTALKQIGPLRLFKDRGKSVYSLTDVNQKQIQKWAGELINEGKLVSIMGNKERFWVPREELKIYLKVYQGDTTLTPKEKKILAWLCEVGAIGRRIPAKMGQDSENSREIKGIGAITIKELAKILKTLEKRLIVHRTVLDDDGKIKWFISDYELNKRRGGLDELEKMDLNYAIGYLLTRYLKYYGPETSSELAYNLDLADSMILKILGDLEDGGQVKAGNYILGKDVPQYLLAHDFEILAQAQGKSLDIEYIEKNQIDKYSFFKSFDTVTDIGSFFEKFGIAYGKREVFIRTKNFNLASWDSALGSKKIVQGRFLSGRVCYVPLADAPMYVSAYRKAELTNVEKTVLNIIKRNRGITRLELSKKLDARPQDLMDIIDKLERNLYIIREFASLDNEQTNEQLVGQEIRGVANRYMFYELKKVVKQCEYKIIKRLISGFGPITAYELQDLTGFSTKIIKDSLNSLVSTGLVVRFSAGGNSKTEYYIPNSELDILKTGRFSTTKMGKVRIVSLFDGYSSRRMRGIRINLGEGWISPIVYHGNLIGYMDLWRLASCIEIRDIIFDDSIISDLYKLEKTWVNKSLAEFKLSLFEQVLNELDKIMKFYNLYGVEIIRLRGIFSSEPKSVSPEVNNVLIGAGYKKVQDFYAKGRLEPRVFNNKQLMKLILQCQHVLPNYRFTNPLTAIRELGGFRSTYEMKLRLDGRFYNIKEFRKNLSLIGAPMIPEYFMYCTEKDLLLYKAAKGRELDFNMEYLLNNMPDGLSISAKNLFKRLTLTQEQFNSARKQLYEGLFIVRDSLNKYRRVQDYPLLTKQFARKYVLKRIIKNFGIFSVENLAGFTRHEFSVKELRKLLAELEDEHELVKGYFREDDDTLYWMHKDALNEIITNRTRFNKRLIVSPQDQLGAYLAPEMRKRFNCGSCFIIIHGFEITGAFRATQNKNSVRISEFIGDNDDWKATEKFFRENKIDIIDEESEELYSWDDD